MALMAQLIQKAF